MNTIKLFAYKINLLFLLMLITNRTQALPCAGLAITVTGVTNTTISIIVTGWTPLSLPLGIYIDVCTSSNFTTACAYNTQYIGTFTTPQNNTRPYIIQFLSPSTKYYIRAKIGGTCTTYGMPQTSATTVGCCYTATKPSTPAISVATCKLIIANWTVLACAEYYTLDVWKVGTPNVYYASALNVDRNSSYSLTPLAPVTAFTTGNYKCKIRYRYIDCNDNQEKWSAYSDDASFTITSPTPNAGTDITVTGCSTSVNLNATALTGALWSIVSGSGGAISNILDPQALFTPGSSTSYTLRWTSPCGDINDVDITFSFVCGQTVYDSRDGNKAYPTVKIGNQCWFRKNLDYGTQINFVNERTNVMPTPGTAVYKYCYNNTASYCNNGTVNYGGLYTGNYAVYTNSDPYLVLCPACWHVASKTEWETLASNYTSSPTAINALIGSSSTSGFDGVLNAGWLFTNFTGFSFYSTCPGSHCWDIAAVVNYWTSTPITYSTNFTTAWRAHLETKFYTGFPASNPYAGGLLQAFLPQRDWGLSVRCIRN